MGGSVSAGKNNDELIDHLVEAEFIRTPLIQQVFRAVDRGNYYCPDQRDNAYRDIAWRMGNLHLSAPCVYSEVMEALKLRPGLSFLNLGSGSGYLSTMAGLILGLYGINHGIELYSDIVDFAYERLDDFIGNSSAVDEYDFCEPSFVVGNCLMLDSSCQQYDRVYCGASCPEEYESYIKNLVKIGGILIMPLNEKLLKITRTGETTWSTAKVLSVSFAPLVAPPSSSEAAEHIKLGNVCPPKLKHICRSNIRAILRKNIDKEHPNLKNKQRRVEIKHRRQVRRIVIPIFDESDLSNHSQSNSEFEYDSDSPEFTISSRIPSRMSVLLEDFLRRHAELQALNDATEIQSHSDSSDSDTKPVDTIDDKDDSDSKIDSENSELTYSASFISMSDKSVTTDESRNVVSSPEKSTSSLNQTPYTRFRRSVNLGSSKTSTNQSSKTDENKKKVFTKRKRPASDDQGTSSSHSQIRARVKRRAATVVWKRIIPRESDSEMEEESKTNCVKVNDDDTYTKHMVKRIADLPLPSSLIRYLNYRRNNM